uniref:KIB1-4 beta-propeller domain-containing protein n=2 Tax=Aegilops tauschii TaxID=37682 RepID=A0A453GC95_AEGTS
DNWMLLKYNHDGFTKTPLMFAGRFYLVNAHGVMVLQIGPNQKPRLEVVAKLNMCVSPISQNMQLVNNCGQLMLLHRLIVPLKSRNNWGDRYDMYRVNLDKGTLFRVKSLGDGRARRAMFLGLYCSFSVSLEVFPSGSISVNTIYPSFDFDKRRLLKVGAYHLPYGRIERPCRLVLGPHTLVDYIALSNMVHG